MNLSSSSISMPKTKQNAINSSATNSNAPRRYQQSPSAKPSNSRMKSLMPL